MIKDMNIVSIVMLGVLMTMVSFFSICGCGSRKKNDHVKYKCSAKWIYEGDGELSDRPVINNKYIVIDQAGGPYEPNLLSMSKNMLVKWNLKLNNIEFPTSGAAIDKNSTIYISGNNKRKIYAISSEGEKVWEYNFYSDINGSPCIVNNNMIVVGADGALTALDSNGKEKWVVETIEGSGVSPVCINGKDIYYCQSDIVYAISLDGKIKWKIALPLNTNDNEDFVKEAIPVSSGSTNLSYSKPNTILIGYENIIFAINTHGEIQWRFKAEGLISRGIAVNEKGDVIFGCGDGKLYSLRGDGSLNWTSDIGKGNSSAPTISDSGLILIGVYEVKGASFFGTYNKIIASLACIDEKGNLIWVEKLDKANDVPGIPVVSEDGMIFVSAGSRLYSFDTHLNGLSKRNWPINGGDLQNTFSK